MGETEEKEEKRKEAKVIKEDTKGRGENQGSKENNNTLKRK
jgi:hypothetical protein